MDKTKIYKIITLVVILSVLIFTIWYVLDEQILEKFIVTDEQDEECIYDPYVMKLKKKLMNWVDSRVEKWPPRLDCLNHSKKKNVHALEMCAGDSSYTIDKEKVYLCVKDKNGNYYDENTMMHVFLHEFAHVLCDEIGHTKLFDEMFECLMDEAHESTCKHQFEKHGRIYNKHIPFPEDYCGITSNDTYVIE